jgi:hypothetical protein
MLVVRNLSIKLLHASLSTAKRKGVSDETLANSIKRSINEAPNNGEMNEGRKRERERTQVQAERMEPKVRHNNEGIMETIMFQNLAPPIARSI